MKKIVAILSVGVLLSGCTTNGPENPTANLSQPKPVTPDTVAIVNGKEISMAELQKPLMQAYGLNMLLNLVQLSVAEQTAAKNHVVVTDADVQAEFDRQVSELFKDKNADRLDAIEEADAKGDKQAAADLRKALQQDNLSLLDQLLKEKNLSRPQFDIFIRTQANLRKIVEPTVKDAVTEKMIEDGFNFRYGQKVEVRHIQVTTQQQVQQVMALLKQGADFGQVAQQMSENTRTAPSGGLLPPFSRATPGLSEVFKSTAFSLKPGEVSDVVNTNGSFQIIKCEQFIEPKAVKLDDVRESLRHDLYEAMLDNGMTELSRELTKDALAVLKIYDPTLKKQFDDRMFQAQREVQGKQETLDRMRAEREQAELRMSTQPTTQSAQPPATMPASTQATSAVKK